MGKTKVLLLSICLFISSFLSGQYRGQLISDTLMRTFDVFEIEEIYEDFDIAPILFPIDYPSIEIHKLLYWTIDAKGENLIEASGLITIPVNSECDFPLLNFNHGTLDYGEALSSFNAPASQHYVGVPFAANGYITVLPDYLGYGETPLTHPHAYVHAKSEGTAVVDMLRASRAFCESYDVLLNGQLFLLGYSNGGHVTMAVHRELEAFHTDEFEITASSPGGGAYDLSGIMLDSMIFSDSYSNAGYISFSALSFQYVYGNIYNDIQDIFVSPYDSIIPLIYNREDPQTFWKDSLPEAGYEILQDEFIDAVFEDPDHPFILAFRDNDLYNWVPQAPLRLYYCEADELIPYVNATFTLEHMLSLGANNVAAYSAGADFDHGECTFPAILGAKLWFDGFRETCSPANVAMTALSEGIKLFPNPFSELLHIDATTLQWVGELEISMYDINGQLVYFEQMDSTDLLTISPEGLAAS